MEPDAAPVSDASDPARLILEEEVLLARLRDLGPTRNNATAAPASLGERAADRMAADAGSWHFLIL